jgi:hypothetical protein
MTMSLGTCARALPLLAAVLGFGCSSGGGTPTFTDVYTTVMVPHGCNQHHAPGKMNDSFLDMSTQSAAYKNLVGVVASGPAATALPPGCGGSGLIRVVAGDSAKSLMYLKVSESTPPCGAQMPFGCPMGGHTCLDATETATIASWINAGALNN